MDKLKELIQKLFKIRGIPQFLFYDFIDPVGMLKVRRMISEFTKKHKFTKIDFILNSPGGSPGDAYRIIKVLRNHFEEVNIIIPFWAKSASTLLSLGGTNIIMNELGEFGPLDVQLRKEKEDSPEYDQESALNDEASLKRIEQRAQELYFSLYSSIYESNRIRLNRTEISKQVFDFVSDFYKPLLEQINPYKIGDKKRKLDIGTQYANKILVQYAPKSIREHIRKLFIDYLVNECPDHGYIIDDELLQKFLPNLVKSTSISEEYNDVLTEISNFLIEDEDEEYIGFIPDINLINIDNGKMILNAETSSNILQNQPTKEPVINEDIKNEKLN